MEDLKKKRIEEFNGKFEYIKRGYHANLNDFKMIEQFIQETIDEVYREAKKGFINKLPEHCFGCENRKRPCTGLHIAEILVTQDKKEL